ncbi:MAG: ABC transporter ATP-binding protein [Acaryochloris sp. RU_4_1]|nr:ABC transporter ATP-binding protein [Acaryochloris sp. SU_5_25]NJM68251.1 ABC transporter ATP-binding protein [Acaryochloris sp. RU_4_1]NJR56549.1 ABC transporter ATP-binding protein [Acaryochloris sp. CRU_2_0]
MAKLEIQHLNKTYTPKVVPVKDLSFTVGKGEFLTLLGPSGCGKSTTLRLIAGLEQPTQGEVIIDDQVVTHKSAGDRDIAMVFQSYALYPHMNVYDNMASGLKLRKMTKADIQQRVTNASQTLNLEDLMHRKPGQLSGGQRQRVALGRALVRNPAVFLLDEPLSNLDALLREQVRAELKKLFEKQQTPVVYVTHDQTEAMTLSSKVAVLYQGELQQLDTPQRIYSHPANQFVAGFIGSPQMNLFTLRCDNQTAILGNTRIPLPAPVDETREIVLGIRPEHVSLATPTDTLTFPGKVGLVENLGMSNLVSLDVQGCDLTLRALLPTDQTWSGDEISLALSPPQLHWFDVQTQTRWLDP